jgi:pimeloyl-ACP methyl ester carboxylesterase
MRNKLIVFISGWMKRDIVWKPMENKFKASGYDVITAYVPSNGFGDIQESACQVAVMLQEVRPFYDKIVVCGHSMGGLIGRVVVQHLGFTDIDAFVSLGTPHNGTYAAYLAPWSESAKQMQPGSVFIESLNGEPWPSDVPALTLQAQFEAIVLPQKNAMTEFGLNRVIPLATHATLPLVQNTFLQTWGWLTYSVFGEPGRENRTGISSRLVLADET